MLCKCSETQRVEESYRVFVSSRGKLYDQTFNSVDNTVEEIRKKKQIYPPRTSIRWLGTVLGYGYVSLRYIALHLFISPHDSHYLLV